MNVCVRPLFLPTILIATLTVVFATVTALLAQGDEAESLGDEERDETVRLIRAELPRWKLWRGDRAKELTLEEKPLLRWTNPGAGRMYGEIYVWTAGGRPEAIMSLYKVWEPAWGFAGELQSLSLSSAVAEREGAVAWKPEQPGITLRDVEGAAAPPAQSTPRRLQQMRALANEFSAALIDHRQNPEGARQELRLLPQPLYRYPKAGTEIVDGAVFAFVLGTDIEVVLLLEARGTKDEARWQYALARLNNDELTAQHKDQEVWRVKHAPYAVVDEPFFYTVLPESRR